MFENQAGNTSFIGKDESFIWKEKKVLTGRIASRNVLAVSGMPFVRGASVAAKLHCDSLRSEKWGIHVTTYFSREPRPNRKSFIDIERSMKRFQSKFLVCIEEQLSLTIYKRM